MFRVIGCVLDQHDLRLVVLSAVLCLFACWSAVSMIVRARQAAGRARLGWLASAGVVAGCGIWAMHFVAMLAYQAGFSVGYDMAFTALSAAIAVVLCAAGFCIALIGNRPLIGGAITGIAVSAMHYVGIAAIRAPALQSWDWRYVAASVVIGIAMMTWGVRLVMRRTPVVAQIAGTGIFTLAICAMHFTGMTAVTFHFDPLILVPNQVLDPATVALAIAAAATLVIALGMIGALVDGLLGRRSADQAERLRAHIAELESTKRALEDTAQALVHARDEADDANRAKSSFLAGMSHELRTPLNAVIGFSEMLSSEIFGPLGHEKYREYAADIQASGAHLLLLIKDILDLSRIDAGEVKLAADDVDLHEVIEDSLRMVAPLAENAAVTVEAEYASELPHFSADGRRLKQVLVNLLGNAVKFTPAGGRIRVRASAGRDGAVIAVSDTGVGIAPMDIARALKRFGQIDSTLARRHEGAGLGLPLAKELMELHGGTLSLESTVGVGTTVTIALPASRALTVSAAA